MERLLDFFTPKSYILDLYIDKHAKTLHGLVTISGKTKTADYIKLHAVGLTVNSLEIDNQPVTFTYENGILTAPATPKSEIKIKVSFHGPIKEDMQGAYLSTYEFEGKEECIVSTQFESHYARECFPCIDEPAAKATFDLSITIPDADDIVLSNTPLATEPSATSWRRDGGYDRVPTSASTVTTGRSGLRPTGATLAQATNWHFQTTPKMSTYLLAFAIGKFNFVEGKTKSGVTVRTFAPLNQEQNLLKLPNDIAIKSLDYYDELFGTPYPLEKLDQVAIPDFEAGAMENWGLVTYRESQLLCDKTSSIATKKAAALTITHELSHQWFGNLVTMEWWNDLWLNESFATIMEYYATDKIFPEFRVWFDFFTQDCLAALYRDAIEGVQAVREDVNDPAEIATLFDPCIVYAKGARLMLMLIREMGEENFYKGIKSYFEKFAYKNTDASDLWVSLEPYTKGFSVRDLMTAWITQPGYPVITDEAQQRFLLDGTSDNSVYPIPEIKDDMSGHYLINLSGPEFDDALKTFDALSSEQRLRILIDRMLLAETPIVASSSLIPLIKKFQNETSAPIWSIIDTIIGKLTLFIDYDTIEETKYKAYLYDTVKTPLKNLGLTPKEGESLNDVELRQTFLGAALYSKDSDFIDSLCAIYTPDLNAMSADTRPFILSAKMWRDEKEFYPFVLEAYKTTSDPELKAELRSALTKPRLKKNIDFAFSMLKDSPLLKPQDHLGFLLRLRRWRYTRDRALDWMFENWDYIYKINGEKSIEDYPRYFAVTIDREEDAKKYFDFFTPLSTDPILARALKVAKSNIDSTLKLISSDKASVLKAINKLS
ncbi:M1 family metallopeptidase [Candidatus Saccharibacteria bacterium]|nr:M1 family metallopeptidase [Candidatus Saccharibacteria bacterium]